MRKKLFQPTDFKLDHSGASCDYGTVNSETNPYNEFIKHKVKYGETLEDLAKRYGISKEAIIKANNGKGGVWGKQDRSKNWLYTGETLEIPIKAKKDKGGQKQSFPNYEWPEPELKTDSVLFTGDYVHGHLYEHILEDRDVWQNMTGTAGYSTRALEEIEVYIFYVNDFSSQSLKLGWDAVDLFGADRVAITEMPSASRFAELWQQMRGDPKIVMINTHGKNQSITTGDGQGDQQLTATGNGLTNIKETKVMNIQDLPDSQANLMNTVLLLNSCHSTDTQREAHLEGDHHQGALSGSMQTAAEAFLRRFNFRTVRGTQEAVNYTHRYNSGWWWGIDDQWEVGDPYPDNNEWQFLSIGENGELIITNRGIN